MDASPGSPANADRAARPLVLVVEDDDMVGEVVQAMLEMGGFQSVVVPSAQKALETLRTHSHPFSLLLTDYRMPGMSGIELIQQTRPLYPKLKTILYSGHADPREASAYPYQPDHFLPKPFTPTVLNSLIRTTLQDATPPSR